MIVLLCCGSCVKEISLEHVNIPSKPVVNALFTGGEPMRIRLSTSRGILEETSLPISDALVTLEREGDPSYFDTLHYKGNYTYGGNKYLLDQNNYRIKISIPGSEVVTSESYLPAPVPIIKATLQFPAGFDEYGDPIKEIKVRFEDPKEVENYYELFLVYQNENSASFSSNHFVRENDPVILAEGLEDFNNSSFLFSDKLFDGEIYEMRLTFENTSYSGTPLDIDVEPSQYNAILRSVSREYYEYRKSWVRHHYHQQVEPSLVKPDPIIEDFVDFLFKGDVQKLETNIRNGYGVFGGYSTSILEIERL